MSWIIAFLKALFAPENVSALVKKILPAGKSEPQKVDILRDLFIKKCLAMQGQKETHGKNRSPMIDADNKKAGVPLGSPYCLTSLMCRLDEACKEMGLKNPIGIQASTQMFFNSVKNKYLVTTGKKGTIAIFQSRSNSSRGHAAAVREDMVKGTNHFETIEFNTDGQGSRDGDGVWPKTRSTYGNQTMRFRGWVDVCAWVIDSNK